MRYYAKSCPARTTLLNFRFLKTKGSYNEVDSMSLVASAEDRINFLKDNACASLHPIEDQLPPCIWESLQVALSRACLSKN